MSQLELFPVTQVSQKGKTIAQAFLEFDEANPHVYGNLRALALEAVRSGRPRLGIGALFEELRWRYMVQTDCPEGEYRLNNNYRALYARKLAAGCPELVNAFETRELKAGSRKRIIIETAAER